MAGKAGSWERRECAMQIEHKDRQRRCRRKMIVAVVGALEAVLTMQFGSLLALCVGSACVLEMRVLADRCALRKRWGRVLVRRFSPGYFVHEDPKHF